MSVVSFCCILSSCAQKNTQTNVDMKVVDSLNIEKYLGTWYEITRFNHSFEKDLVGVTATYSLKKNGKIKVLNQGYKFSLDGKHSEAIGKAKIPNPKEPAKLKVSFFWFFYADYFILELDENYQWAMVSSGENYLWILSRTPKMENETYQMILEKAKKRGFKVENLILVEQG